MDKFKVAFICPGYESLGLEYLSAILKNSGFCVELFLDPILFDESGFVKNKVFKRLFKYDDTILKNIIDFQPSLVGIPVLSDNFPWACKWAQLIKSYLDAPIILGGIHPTSVPENVINNPYVDYLCLGDGEIALLELCQYLRKKKDVYEIKNIWHKSNGQIFRNSVRAPLELDNLPFPDKVLFLNKYSFFKYGYMTSTSRGCIFKCAYCCNNLINKIYNNRFYRQRSIENVIKELKLAKRKYHPKFIHFVDEIFNANTNWLKEFLKIYKKEIDLPFDCYIYPDLVDSSLAHQLKSSGCFKIQMGVQTINENIRKNLFKRYSFNEKIKEAILIFKKLKIFVTCDNILGIPGEKEEDLISLCNFYNKYTPDCCELFWLRFYPETDITLDSLRKNFLSSRDYENIKEGKVRGGLVNTRFKHSLGKVSKRYSLLLKFIPYIPKRIRKIIIKFKIFYLFPYVPFDMLTILNKSIKKPKYDIYTQQTLGRYTYFMIRKFLRRQ